MFKRRTISSRNPCLIIFELSLTKLLMQTTFSYIGLWLSVKAFLVLYGGNFDFFLVAHLWSPRGNYTKLYKILENKFNIVLSSWQHEGGLQYISSCLINSVNSSFRPCALMFWQVQYSLNRISKKILIIVYGENIGGSPLGSRPSPMVIHLRARYNN